MRILSSLKGFTADCSEKNGVVTVNIADSDGGRLFDILHCCEPVNIKGFENPLYIGMEYPSGFIAESVTTGERIILFDSVIHGYDAMFCNIEDSPEISDRPLKKADFSPCEIRMELFYDIDYETEKERYNFDKNGNCILINGKTVSWEQVLNDGIDAMALYYRSAGGRWIEFSEEELA
ncbi:MAG: hypothetical protein K2J40_09920 [Ruminococcus sp.]|nr:hypothetical protein [Ruminococcus sp.]